MKFGLVSAMNEQSDVNPAKATTSGEPGDPKPTAIKLKDLAAKEDPKGGGKATFGLAVDGESQDRDHTR